MSVLRSYFWITKNKDRYAMEERSYNKMLGRRKWYKALENCLIQMWTCNRVLSIVDLGHEYYPVTFTNEEDQDALPMDGH